MSGTREGFQMAIFEQRQTNNQMKTILIVSILIIVVIIFSENENKNRKKMDKRKRACQFITRDWNNTESERPVKVKGIFHRWGDEAGFGIRNQPTTMTVAIIEDHDGQIHTVNPNDVKFIDK